MNKTQVKKKVDLKDLGLFIKVVQMDHRIRNDKHLCKLIEENFDVECTQKELDQYRMLHIELEDYEKLSRMAKEGIYECYIE
jgi:hypothetical protein